MGGDKLLEEYIDHLKNLKESLHPDEVVYTVKSRDEIRLKDPSFEMQLIAEGNYGKRFDFLENGHVFYYRIYEEDGIFLAILCKKTSRSTKTPYYNNLKTYRAITNSADPEKLDHFLFKNSEIITIDDAIKKIESLRR